MTKSQSKHQILVIEDDQVLNRLIVDQLGELQFDVFGAPTWHDARQYLASHEPSLILLDLRLPDADGSDLIPELAGSYPLIVLTAYGSIETAVNAIKNGAVEYLSKPVNIDELELEVKRALRNAELHRDYQFVKGQQQTDGKTYMVGSSMALKEVVDLVRAVAQTDATVLIHGESGVGKELVAREIHRYSPRKEANFVALDCCTLQENLFESELFGHEKGAFTGATSQKRGLIEGAHHGTLFLDEIGEISPSVQAKLLRVIETGQFRRVGGLKDLSSLTRIVAATNQDLEKLSQTGDFRLDLYYRLSAFVITIPPLRERRGDIPQLAEYFLNNHDFSRRISKKFSDSALHVLSTYDWPGNIRELRNIVERAVILSGTSSRIDPKHLGLSDRTTMRAAGVKLTFDHEPTLDEMTQEYLKTLLSKYSGHRAKIAQCLGMSERSVYRLIKKLEQTNPN